MSLLWVTGAGGLLGREVVRAGEARGYEVVALDRSALDVTDANAVRERFLDARPEWVVHCAAYTAVDRAEEEPEVARRVNVEGARNVAQAAVASGAWVVHVSTDYVFDGEAQRPYRPDAATGPRSVYGRTKLDGEREVLAASPLALVVRTSWLYGAGGRNFVTSMLERGRAGLPLRVVGDQTGRPTWARNAAHGLLDLFERRVRGVWHVADGGTATWFELVMEAFRRAGIEAEVESVTTADWGAPAPRPRYSVLDLAGTEALLGRASMDWREALGMFLEEIGVTGGAHGRETDPPRARP